MQGYFTSEDQARNIVAEVMSWSQEAIHSVSYHVFSSIVSHTSNDAFDTAKLQRYQDMTRPLTHYYIAASHYTFLATNQSGKASAERYEEVLCKGCRSVEVKCWDGDDGDPDVCYGPSSSSKVKLVGK